MLGVQHHALSPPASKLNGITVLSPSAGAAKLQSSPSLKNNSLKKNSSPTLDFETSSQDISAAWLDIPQEVKAGEENGEDARGREERKDIVAGREDSMGMANGANGDSVAVVDGDDGFADASRNLELDMAAIDAQLAQGFGSTASDGGVSVNPGEAEQPSASTIDSATERPLESTGNDEEGQTVEAQEPDATSPITPLDETPSKPRKSSSPLSDLSPVPTHDEDEVKEEGVDNAENSTTNGATGAAEVSSINNTFETSANPDGFVPLKPPENNPSHLSADPPSSSLPPSSSQPSSSSQPQARSDPSSSQSSTLFPSADVNLHSIPTNALAGPSNSAQLNGATPGSSVPTSLSKGDASQKVLTILELNAELFKVCLAFQASGIAMTAPEAQPFSKKLSSNLTWLAAHADNASKTLAVEIPLPEMDPPTIQSTSITIPNIERINAIYVNLPNIFAKDITRRERKAALKRASATPSVSTGPLPQPHTSSTPLSRAPSVSSVSTAPLSSGVGVKRERDGTGHESPNSHKRQNTGDGRVGTPGPAPGAMLPPPAVPDMTSVTAPMQPNHQQTRPGSAMGVNMGSMNMNTGMAPSPSAMMMSRSSSSSSSIHPGASGSMPGMPGRSSGSPVNMQNMPGIPNAQSPDPQAMLRARQMQMRQAQFQQQQQHMQQSNMGMQGQQMPAQMQNVQQMQQQQHFAQQSRQMSPPQGVPGMAGGMGTSPMPQQVSLGMPNQAGGMANSPAPGMSSSQITPQILQQIQAMGPAAVQSFQALQNPSNPLVRYLKESIPGFEHLPLPQQLSRMQQVQAAMQRRNQANTGNPMMANPMMANQMRNPNMMASGSVHQGMSQQLGQGGLSGIGVSNMGMAQQMQSSTSDGSGGMFPNAAGMVNRGMGNTGMGMMNPGGGSNQNAMQMQQMQQQLAGMNPQQRQLYLMQMQQQQSQMRGAGAGSGGMPGGSMGVGASGMNMGGMSNMNSGMMNPSMMNPQMLAQQQRLMAQRQGSQGSPLNPGAVAGPSSAGVDLTHQQYPPGLRSNPSVGMPGIARSTSARSPSVSDMGSGTPRLGGRMLPGQGQQNDEYHRALMHAQAQRAQMQQQQQQQQQQQGFMHGAGGQGQMPGHGQWANQSGMSYGAGTNMPSPSAAGNWSQQSGQQGYAMAGSPAASVHQSDHPGTPQQSSSTPAPMIHHSPTTQPTEFDSMMNW